MCVAVWGYSTYRYLSAVCVCGSVGIQHSGSVRDIPGWSAGCGSDSHHAESLLQPPSAVPGGCGCGRPLWGCPAASAASCKLVGNIHFQPRQFAVLIIMV